MLGDEFVVKYSFSSNPRAIYRALRRSAEVKAVRAAIDSGEVSENAVRLFVSSVLRNELRPNHRFPHELALAAIAVALESRASSFAEEYIGELAALELAEIPISIRIAREVRRRRKEIPANRTKVFSLSDDQAPPVEWKTICSRPAVSVGDFEGCFAIEAR